MFSPIISVRLPYRSLIPMEQQTLILGRINYARRLLLHSPLHKTPDSLTPYSTNRRFDSHIVLILSILLCVLVGCLVLNSIIRCALRCMFRPPTTTDELIDPATPAAATEMGLKKKAIEMFPMMSYSAELKLPGLASECVICLSEFVHEEMVRVLPKCNHWFHVKCIDKWLESHSSCPTCRRCLLATCKKVIGFDKAENHEPVMLPHENEGFVRPM